MIFATPFTSHAQKIGRYTLLLLAFTALTGCCKDASLLQWRDTDERIESKVRAELEGVTDLQERFHVVAGMVDWSLLASDREWGPYKVVGWHPTGGGAMTIPIASWCYLGVVGSHSEVIIAFDESGSVKSVSRQERQWGQTQSDYLSLLRSPWFALHADPWQQIEPQGSRVSVWSFVEKDGTASAEVHGLDPSASRYVDLITYGYWPAHLESPKVRIRTDPPIEFIVTEENGPHCSTPDLAGAYMVQARDFAVRSRRPLSARFEVRAALDYQFVPQQAVFYQCGIILAPHEGVAIHVEFVEGQEAAP